MKTTKVRAAHATLRCFLWIFFLSLWAVESSVGAIRLGRRSNSTVSLELKGERKVEDFRTSLCGTIDHSDPNQQPPPQYTTPDQTICDSDNRLTKWQEWICALPPLDEIQPPSWPRFYQTTERPSSTTLQHQGLIVVFHGFSSCPNTADALVEVALQNGFDVMVPLLPGHGFKPGECIKNEPFRIIPNQCAGISRSDERMPTTRQAFVDWVATINDIVIDEVCRQGYQKVFAVGLSMGAPLATFAVNTGPAGLNQRIFLLNPLFGASFRDRDLEFVSCQAAGGEQEGYASQALAKGASGLLGAEALPLDVTFDNLVLLLQPLLGNDQFKSLNALSEEEKYFSIY